MNLEYLGLPDGSAARITAVHKERYAIVSQWGEGYARLKGKEYYAGTEAFPTVGDYVKLDYNPSGDSRILGTYPRKTWFSRRDPDKGRGEQAVAANFDYVFILQSVNQDFNPKRLERYMTLSWQSGAIPVVVLTKMDLVSDASGYLLEAERAAAGAAVHGVSAKTGAGLDDLRVYLQPGKTLVFLGSSGVGKSSLVNAMVGKQVMDVGGIREDDGKGRHTTTHRQMLMLDSGTMVIDTPGMRELGMWDVSQGLGEAFSDVERFLGKCRFSDCRHDREPGCAIKAALASGELDIARWESYCKLKEEALDKEELLRRKREWSKGVAKYTRQRNKEVW